MLDKKDFTSVEELLSESGGGAKSPNRTNANADTHKNKKQNFGSIDDVPAAARIAPLQWIIPKDSVDCSSKSAGLIEVVPHCWTVWQRS